MPALAHEGLEGVEVDLGAEGTGADHATGGKRVGDLMRTLTLSPHCRPSLRRGAPSLEGSRGGSRRGCDCM